MPRNKLTRTKGAAPAPPARPPEPSKSLSKERPEAWPDEPAEETPLYERDPVRERREFHLTAGTLAAAFVYIVGVTAAYVVLDTEATEAVWAFVTTAVFPLVVLLLRWYTGPRKPGR